MAEIKTRCLIIGSGPAGYTAAIYASRANISPLVIEGLQPGGQLTITTEVENFPGQPNGITGPQLMEDIRTQALKFGADIRSGLVTEVDFSKRPFKAVTNNGLEILADTVIISTGASARYLGLPDEEKYSGLGVSACATCDGFFYRKKRVAVVGGGDTACEEALYLSNLASDVFLIVRKPHLRASKVMQERVLEKSNIKVLFNTNTTGLYGEEYLEGAHLVENVGTQNSTTTSPSTDSSSPSATIPTPRSSASTSTAMQPAISRSKAHQCRPTSPESLPQVMLPTPYSVRPSWLPAQAARLRSKPNVSSTKRASKKISL